MALPLDTTQNEFDERWLSPGGVVPVDPVTTGALVREVERLRKLQSLSQGRLKSAEENEMNAIRVLLDVDDALPYVANVCNPKVSEGIRNEGIKLWHECAVKIKQLRLKA